MTAQRLFPYNIHFRQAKFGSVEFGSTWKQVYSQLTCRTAGLRHLYSHLVSNLFNSVKNDSFDEITTRPLQSKWRAKELCPGIKPSNRWKLEIVTHPNGSLYKGGETYGDVNFGQAQIGERSISAPGMPIQQTLKCTNSKKIWHFSVILKKIKAIY